MTAELELLRRHAETGWLGGEPLAALVPCRPFAREHYRVRGLDEDGVERDPNRALRTWDRLANLGPESPATVRGPAPDCLAVGFMAAVTTRSWLALTPSRLGLLELGDRGRPAAASFEAVEEEIRDSTDLRSVFGGLAKAAKAMASDFRHTMASPELTERPGDAELVVRLERPRADLVATEPVGRLVPLAAPGVRLVFADQSWVKVESSDEGVATLTS